MGELKREIGFLDAVLLVINSIVGTGIFFVPQITASILGLYSYPAWIFLSWFSVLVSIIFAEFIYFFPKAGGVYEYAKRSIGELAGFIAGWLEIFVSWIVIAMIIARVSEEVSAFLGINPFLVAFLLLFAFHLLVYTGIKGSKISLLFFAYWTILTLTVGYVYFFNLATFPRKIIIKKQFDFFPFLLVLFLAFESYARWENITFLAEETKEPKKTLPLALLIGNWITVVLYLFLSFFIIFSAVKFGQEIYYISPVGNFLLFLVLIQSLGTAFAWIVVIPRLLFALGRDRALPESFSVLNKYGAPKYAILLQFIVILFFVLTGSFEKLLSVIPSSLAILYLIVSFGYIRTKAKYKGGIVGKKLGFLIGAMSIALFLIIFLIGKTNSLFALLISLSALPVYLGLNIHKFKGATRHIHNYFSFILDFLSKFWIRKEYIYDILLFLFPLNGKKVLDFGCSVGELSIALAREGAYVIASDISEVELNILKKKIEKLGIKNIKLELSDKDRINHRDLDAVVSIGALGYITDKDKFLDDLSKALKKRGKIFFVEFDNVLKMFVLPGWIRDEKKVKEEFRKRGFVVDFERRKGILWDTIYIYGFKK